MKYSNKSVNEWTEHTKGEEQNMTLVVVAWIAFGLGTTAGFLLARSIESVSDSIVHAEHDVAGN